MLIRNDGDVTVNFKPGEYMRKIFFSHYGTQAALKIKRHSFETVIFNLSHPLGPLSCPRDHDEGHLNGLSCYYKHSTSKTWEEARKDCIASGSNLVKINSTKETDTGFLTRLLDTINFKEVDELNKSDQKTGSTMK